MLLQLFTLGALITLGASTSTQFEKGNWGYISFMSNPSKCYGESFYTSKQKHILYSVDCHADLDNNLDTMMWRYDPSTHQLQNKGLSDKYAEPYCLSQSEIENHAKLLFAPCKGNVHFKWLIRAEHGGAVQQIVSESDGRYCIDIWGSTVTGRGHSFGALASCNSVTAYRTEQWTNFLYKSKHRSADLSPVVDPSIADGNWGFFKVRVTGSCYAVDSINLVLEQRYCNDNDDAQKFRYIASTMELRNWRYPLTEGGKGCITRTGSSFYITRCTGSSEQKFIIVDGMIYTGMYQQIKVFNDQRKCLYVHGSGGGHKNIYSTTCQREMTDTSDQWVEFLFWRSSLVCPAGQIPSQSNTCKPCSAGTYNPAAGADSCTVCPAGTTSQSGATSCTFINTCTAGYYMRRATGVCHPCPINTYTDTAGNTACTICPDGSHTTTTGSTQCIPDLACPAGTFVNGPHCTSCPVNTYSNRANSAACTACPAGHYTEGTGSSSCISRTYCGPGKFHNGHVCQKCPRNTYDNTVGNTACTPCPKGTETKQTGATRCTRKNNCAPGSFFSEHENKCALCPRNTFTDRSHQVECKQCPAGTGTRAEGATGCTKINYCRPGKYHDGEKCTDCPRNTFSDETGAWECTSCPHGTKTDGAGATACREIVPDDCSAGKFYNGEICQLCSKNTFSDIRGMRYCKRCPDGYETETAGATSCTRKAEIGVIAEADTTQISCYSHQSKPACLLKCRFRTNTGIKMTNKANVKFSRLLGTQWHDVGTTTYNKQTNWFSTKIAERPGPAKAGVYKCEGSYGESTGSVTMEVTMLSQSTPQ